MRRTDASARHDRVRDVSGVPRPSALTMKSQAILVYAQRTVSNPSGVTVRALANGQSGLKTKSACNSITEEDARLAAEAMGRRFHHAAP